MGVGVYVFSVRCLAVSLAGGRAFSVAIQPAPITPHSEPSQLGIPELKHQPQIGLPGFKDTETEYRKTSGKLIRNKFYHCKGLNVSEP
jgi:hypothetical protein